MPGHLYGRPSSGSAASGNGARVGILGGNCPQWVEWAWGTWLAGATVVPLPAPLRVWDPASFSGQVASLATATGCSVVVGDSSYLRLLEGDDCPRVDWSGEGPRVQAERPAQVAPTDLAAVLCTSGSTATPKGVRLTHGGAAGRARRNAWTGPAGTAPVLVFPFYNAAGLEMLFGVTAAPFGLHLLSTARFSRDPAKWLRLVSELRARSTKGASSVWAVAVKALSRNPEGTDLSCLHSATFNSEIADAAVVDRVQEVCAPLGLADGSLGVVYGSSEAGLISQTEAGKPLRVDNVDLDELSLSSRAVAAAYGRPLKRVVSCGPPSPGVEVRIGSPADALPERCVGDVWVRGPDLADGYLNDSSGGQFVGDWLRTADLGYVADGELFVIGRSDEVIIRLGRKHYPEDIEQAVRSGTSIGERRCVAFSPRRQGQGDLVVVLEVSRDPGNVVAEARVAIASAVGLTPSAVVLVPEGTVPTTASGKLQRGLAREMYERGE